MSFKSSDEVFSYFESFTNLERTMSFTEREYRLDRMYFLLDLFDNPQNKYKTIHVAGSKGKGSTAAALASMLANLGYKTGLYTSPHLLSYKERISHAGIFIDENTLIKTGIFLKSTMENTVLPFPDPPTTFELLSLYAFLLFEKTKCEWAVIETGIGGRLDATNVIVPQGSVITPVEMEHADILGDTIEKIAFEKSGIIKNKKNVFVSPQKPRVLKVIKKSALEKEAQLFSLEDIIKISSINLKKEGTFFKIHVDNRTFDIKINLAGEFQAYNASLALLAVKTVLNIPWKKAVLSLGNIPLKGRVEITGRKNSSDIIIDSSHTPDSALMFSKTMKSIYKSRGILIFGSVEGKDFLSMIKNMEDCFDSIIISKPGNFKRSCPEKIFNTLKMTFSEKDIILETDAVKALSIAENLSEKKKHIAVTGSFYMASEIKKLLTGEN